jgi:hypothetical protein
MKGNKVAETQITKGVQENTSNCLLENMKGTDLLQDLGEDGRPILKCRLK